jgi:RNA polymerase sigma factor (sigma-70 family)
MSWDGIHDLVRALQAGDEPGWAALHEMARPYLLRLAERILGPGWPGESVSDLMQKTWQRVLAGLGGFRGGENDAQTGALLRAWLAQTMRNVYRNDRRYEGAQRRGQGVAAVSVEALATGDSAASGAAYQPQADDPSPSANAMAEERRLAVQKALESLPDPIDRTIVQQKVFAGMSIGEIAAALNLSYDQVRKRFHDSLERLRPTLQRLE